MDKEAIEKAARTLAELVDQKVVSTIESEITGRFKEVGVGLISDLIGAVGRKIEGKIHGTPTGERSR